MPRGSRPPSTPGQSKEQKQRLKDPELTLCSASASASVAAAMFSTIKDALKITASKLPDCELSYMLYLFVGRTRPQHRI